MGIAVSLILVAVGAVLVWGVEKDAEGLNVDAVGVILMVVGLVGAVLTMMFWESWFGRGAWGRRGGYVEGAPPAAGYRRGGRRVVVEEEDVGGPPAAGPPPPP